MVRKKSKIIFGYKHIKKRHQKRSGRHSKKLNKHSHKKKNRGQG